MWEADIKEEMSQIKLHFPVQTQPRNSLVQLPPEAQVLAVEIALDCREIRASC